MGLLGLWAQKPPLLYIRALRALSYTLVVGRWDKITTRGGKRAAGPFCVDFSSKVGLGLSCCYNNYMRAPWALFVAIISTRRARALLVAIISTERALGPI